MLKLTVIDSNEIEKIDITDIDEETKKELEKRKGISVSAKAENPSLAEMFSAMNTIIGVIYQIDENIKNEKDILKALKRFNKITEVQNLRKEANNE